MSRKPASHSRGMRGLGPDGRDNVSGRRNRLPHKASDDAGFIFAT